MINIPIYKYKCTNETCGKEINRFCRMSEYKATIKCTECDGDAVRKVDDLVCGMSIDMTNSFFRKVN